MNPTLPKKGLGSTAETNRLLGGNFFDETSGTQLSQFTPSAPSTTFDASAIAASPRPITIPEDQTSTLADGIVGQTPAILDNIKLMEKMEADRAAKEAEVKEGKNFVSKAMDAIKGKYQEFTAAQGDKNSPGTPEWQKEQARLISLELDKSQRAQLNEIAALDGRGLTDRQKEARGKAITRKYALEQGDLQLKYHIAASDYNASIDTLNKKFQLELEPLKLEHQDAKDIYNQIKGDLTKSEDRIWQQAIKESDNAVKEKQDTQKYIASVFETLQTNNPDALKNNPQLAVQLSNAKSAVEVGQILARAGVTLADPLDRQAKLLDIANKQAQLRKLNIEISDAEAEELSDEDAYEEERQTRVLNSVDELRERVNIQTVGFASLGNFLPGSIPRNFKADLETLKASIAFGELAAMRAASKTGGALGNVSERELALLESALAGLDQGQSPANFKKNLDKVEESIKRWQKAAGKTPASTSSSGYKPGDIVQYQGKQWRVAADGDTLEPL